MELIDKAAVVREIEKLSAYLDSLHEQRIIEKILSIIDTLEVKEVDLKKEVDDYVNEYFSECDDGVLISDANSMELTLLDITPLVKHFFELGLKTKNNNESIHRH